MRGAEFHGNTRRDGQPAYPVYGQLFSHRYFLHPPYWTMQIRHMPSLNVNFRRHCSMVIVVDGLGVTFEAEGPHQRPGAIFGNLNFMMTKKKKKKINCMMTNGTLSTDLFVRCGGVMACQIF